VPCIEIRRVSRILLPALVLVLGGCGGNRLPPWPAPSTNPAPVESRPEAKAPSASRSPNAAEPVPALGAPRRARNWDEFRLLAARRMVAANKAHTYDGTVPEPLLAIPVLEIELNADGSIRRIVVSRTPGQATDTVQIAIDAVKRAAPFGEVSHLPKPWKFTEVFLFDDERRFKPRTLDL
jgi:hypothetical protein